MSERSMPLCALRFRPSAVGRAAGRFLVVACVWLMCGLAAACGEEPDAPDRPGSQPAATAPVSPVADTARQPGAASDLHAGADADASATAGAAGHTENAAPPLSADERVRAERILDFHNTAAAALTNGYYALPDALYAHARTYLRVWHLPRVSPLAGARNGKSAARAALRPEKGLFTDAEADALTTAQKAMDTALDALLERYGELERYVKDASIRDDGARGRKLVRQMDSDHAVFMAARKSWLEIVTARAAEAEAALLREHPLRRQIQAANTVFALYDEVADALAADKGAATAATAAATPSATSAGMPAATPAGMSGAAPGAGKSPEAATRTTLERLRAELAACVADAARPPFAAAPSLERRYRVFLKEAQAYLAALDHGLNEGFFAAQRRELNTAAARSRAAYNLFVTEANGIRKP